ncbi:MAG: hypothetical protein QM775_02370 [Pirellulales bacterium]
MNYFAHGYRFVDDPYFLAGTAVPDWLSVIDRRVRVRPKDAAAHAECSDPILCRVARGVARHHADDAMFHAGAAFNELNWRFTATIRDLLGGDAGMRPSFLGHILVELLLDSVLIEERPALLDDYYSAMAEVENWVVEEAVNRMQSRRTERLAVLISIFTRERFLCDYPSDERLLRRLNQVMKRVGLEQLPDRLCEMLPAARTTVRERRNELLEGA